MARLNGAAYPAMATGERASMEKPGFPGIWLSFDAGINAYYAFNVKFIR
jgi:hypothetical protein